MTRGYSFHKNEPQRYIAMLTQLYNIGNED